MMDILDNNIEAIKLYMPYLWEHYEKIQKDKKSTEFVVSKKIAKDGSYSLYYEKENNMIRLNSSYRPVEEAQKWAKSFDFINLQTVIEMYGLGNGMFVRELSKKMKNEDALIVYEPNLDIFEYCLQEFDMVDIISNENIFIFVEGINELQFEMMLAQKVAWYNLDFQWVLIHPNYEKVNAEKYRWFHAKIVDTSELVMISRNTDAYFGKEVISNVFKNIKYFIDGVTIHELEKEIPKDIPGIIVSGGPSLRKNVHQLKKAKGKAIIIAVDTALSFLEQNDIKPDLMITIDPKKPMKFFSERYLKELPLVCSVEAKSEALEINNKKKILYGTHELMKHLYEKVGITLDHFNSGGSVATAAFSACIALNLKRIVFVGQDLAFDGEFTHVNQTIADNNGAIGIKEVEGIDGKLIKTRYDWFIFLTWFQNAIARYPDIDFIDATEGGAKIKGTRICTLEEVIEKYCTNEFEFEKVYEGLKPSLDIEKQQDMLKYLNEFYEQLSTIKSKSKEAINILLKEISIYKKKGVTREIENLTQKVTNIGLDIESKEMYSIVDTYLSEFARDKLGDIYKFNKEDEDDTLKTFLLSEKMYGQIIEVVNEIELIMKQGIEQYESKMYKTE